MWSIQNLLRPLASAFLVIVFLFFVLIQQRELRTRVVQLFGDDKLAETTRLLDETGQRISRYLLMPSLINGSFPRGSSTRPPAAAVAMGAEVARAARGAAVAAAAAAVYAVGRSWPRRLQEARPPA